MPVIILWLTYSKCISAVLLACYCFNKQRHQNKYLSSSVVQFKHLKVWGQGVLATVASLEGLDLGLIL